MKDSSSWTIWDYYRVLYRFKKRALAVVILAVLLGVTWIAYAPRQYESEAKLFVRIGWENAALDPPMSRGRVLRIALVGFALVVGLVLMAAYLGYRGSDRIQNTAQALVREHLVQSERGAEVEAIIVKQTQEMIDELGWVLGLCFLLAMMSVIHNATMRNLSIMMTKNE